MPALAIITFILGQTRGVAQPVDEKHASINDRARSFRDRVTDRVSLKDGTQIYGLAVSEKPVKLLVRTAWLEQQLPDFFRETITPELSENRKKTPSPLVIALQSEISRLNAADPDEFRRAGLLKEVQKRLAPDDGEVPPFIFIEAGKSQLRSFDAQKDQRRELCRLAVLNDLKDYEDAHWKTVAEQLQAIPELSRQTAFREQEDSHDEQLEQIMAAVDHQLGTVTRLVQSGGEVFEEGQQLDFGALMSSMMGSNVQSLMNHLLTEGGRVPQDAGPDSAFPSSAGKLADRNQHRTVVISSFDFNLDHGVATVTKRLFRKKEDGSWRLTIQISDQASSADLKPGQAEELANDPQIREIAVLANGLGIGGNQLETALSMGAIVRQAMIQADHGFAAAIQAVMNTRKFASSTVLPTVRLE